MARFIIRRMDMPGSADSTALESEGLTIGRSQGNDLVLNNRSVSRTHAGIKEIQGEFWLFNLSGSNGTFLNGSPSDQIPLADGDVVQVGPYYLQIQYLQSTLSVTVRMELEMKAVAAKAESGSMMSAIPSQTGSKKKSMTIGGNARPPGTGFMTSMVPPPDEEALRIFWEKRKREAGKIGIKTLLRPKRIRGMGKTQFNWRPTTDLRKPWPVAFFTWGAAVVLLTAMILLIFTNGYSPGSLSSPHLAAQPAALQIAKKANAGSCSNCHAILHTMQTNCASCHTTSHFDPSISKAHLKASIGCLGCHGEHQGKDFRPGLVTSTACISCHNDRYRYGGKVLGIPHGGSVGYPVKDGKWDVAQISVATWQRKNLPNTPADFSPSEQFHLIHLSGVKEGRLFCRDCHVTANNKDARFLSAPKSACDRCHSARVAAVAGPECVSCHEQHGVSKNQVASLRKEFTSPLLKARYENIEQAGIGGAGAQRQNQVAVSLPSLFARIGGFRWSLWFGIGALLLAFGFVVVLRDQSRNKKAISQFTQVKKPVREKGRTIDLELMQREGPSYPHPVVDPVLCIGCHACVEACPHDVLAIVGGISVPVAPDQCMEDTGCEAECPTSPKACVVLNTKKVIPPRKVPRRDTNFMTDVPGVYLIGDVSGVPLIKNAVNEGAQVMEQVIATLNQSTGKADYDVAIVGIGPGGLSATVLAKQKGLKYVALEQEIVASTIQNYPAGKYVFYKPDSVKDKGGIPVPGPGGQKEDLVKSWLDVIERNKLKINEEETCKSIKKEEGFFRVVSERGKMKDQVEYTARKVVLAIGSRGAPMKLGVPGEEMIFEVRPDFSCFNCGALRVPQRPFCANCGQRFEIRAKSRTGFCTECGIERIAGADSCANCNFKFQAEEKKPEIFGTMEFSPDMLKQLEKATPKVDAPTCLECGSLYLDSHRFCPTCGVRILRLPQQPFQDSRVKYKLSNPDDYVGKHCIVVGGGNSAIEAAVDLCGFRRVGEKFIFMRDNIVTLLVRSEFKGDLKLGNKINVYDCIDAGKIKCMFGAAIKELTETEAVIINVRSKQEIARIPNDYAFALIGGEKPTKFLEQIGIKIG